MKNKSIIKLLALVVIEC